MELIQHLMTECVQCSKHPATPRLHLISHFPRSQIYRKYRCILHMCWNIFSRSSNSVLHNCPLQCLLFDICLKLFVKFCCHIRRNSFHPIILPNPSYTSYFTLKNLEIQSLLWWNFHLNENILTTSWRKMSYGIQ